MPDSRIKRRPTSRGGPTDSASLTTYPLALRYLHDRVDIERMRVVRPADADYFKLDRTRRLLEALGHPERQLQTVHIAGSKGKGSTVAMLSAGLVGCGLTVGQFTSPHLVDIRERIRINTSLISRPAFLRCVQQVADAAAEMEDDRPHFFELMTAIAYCRFVEQAVDVALIETGLGGRLDSTNVLTPVACGITQISLDHMHILGDTLPQIAREKAGILKPGVPAVSTPQEPEVEAVLRAVAAEVGTEIRFLGSEIQFSKRFEASPDRGRHSRICLTTQGSLFEHLPVPLLGEHQALNCGLTLALIDCLRNCGFELPEENVTAGIGRTRLEGRMELLPGLPRVLVDGAHNAASMRALVRSIGAHIQYDSLVVILGCGQDKDIDGILEAIAQGADKIIFTVARNSPRALKPEELQSRFANCSGRMSQVAPSLSEALGMARAAVSREDLICVTGSFYLVGEAKKMVAGGRDRTPIDKKVQLGRGGTVVIRSSSARLPQDRKA